MAKNKRTRLAALAVLAAFSAPTAALGQALPNPYRLVDGWAKLPGGREIGAVGDLDIDVDGRHVWAVLRCDAGGDKFGYECLDSNLDVVVKLIGEAKAQVLQMAAQGYRPRPQRTDIPAIGESGLALFKVILQQMRAGGQISEHDQKIGAKLAYILCGGDLTSLHFVSEQYIMDLEREVFLSLCGEPKTVERIKHTLKTDARLKVDGSITLEMPYAMRNCQLIYQGDVWNLGDLQPGQPVQLPADYSQVRNLSQAWSTGGVVPAYNPRQRFNANVPVFGSPTGTIRQMMFFEVLNSTRTGQRGDESNYLDFLDQSWRLNGPEAILLGVLDDQDGSSTDINDKDHIGTRLKPFNPKLRGTMKQNTVVRFYLPLAAK